MPSLFKSTPRKEKPTGFHSKAFTVPSRERAGVGMPYSPCSATLADFGALQAQSPLSLPFVTDDTRSLLSGTEIPPALPPKFTFASTHVPSTTEANSIDSFAYGQDEVTAKRQYGFLGGVGAKVTLSLEDAGKVVKVVGRELESRALTIPLLFSTQALEVNPTRTRMLIESYMATIRNPQPSRRDTWIMDIAFAKEHDLAWLLRWALSRIVRTKESTGQVCHGILEWEVYEEWRGRERSAGFPQDAFPYLSGLVPADVFHEIISPLFALLTRFAAYSHLSGLTPHALASLFGPFMFDIPSSAPCLGAHATFVKAAYATEHLLLSYIRSSGQNGLGVTDLPTRLRDWVVGYPAMIASDADLARATPRHGARTVRCERISRTVRAYSRDLLGTAELWAEDFEAWDAWDRVVLKNRRGDAGRPKFSLAWRRRLAVKDHLLLPTSAITLNGEMSYGQASRTRTPSRDIGKSHRQVDEDGRWGSVAGREWSMFEEGGFDAPSLCNPGGDIKDRLQFDLNETAKQGVTERRQTMNWTEFAAPTGGFSRTEPLLNVSLSFAPTLSTSIVEWPKERDELQRRLQKSQKEATPFSYDTRPKMGPAIDDPLAKTDSQGRVFIEEAFIDCWADWMIGGAWMDRDELTFKETNWVLIEYKARPPNADPTGRRDPLADPRTSEQYFMFEERVPVDYQMAVADPKQRRTLGTFFRTPKKKNGESPIKNRTSNGWTDNDFDKMLLHKEKTKHITLSRSEPPNSSAWQYAPQVPKSLLHPSPNDPDANFSSASAPVPMARMFASAMSRTRSIDKVNGKDDPHVVESKPNFFSKRDKAPRRPKPSQKVQQSNEVDYELHSASGISSPDTSPKDSNKREEDKWMDILIANGAKPMDRQSRPPALSGPSLTVAAVPGGLPSSPRPPARLPSRQRSRELSRDTIDTDPRLVEPERSISGTFSAETSTSETDVVGPETPPPVDLRLSLSGKRKPVPEIGPEVQIHELTPPDCASEDVRRQVYEVPIPSLKESGGSPVIIEPKPNRDTIHNIVDTYNRDSTVSFSGSDVDESELSYRQDPDTLYTTRFADARFADAEASLHPPVPIFDLTPGRVPSPARYKHGEPLQFVDEREEEEY